MSKPEEIARFIPKTLADTYDITKILNTDVVVTGVEIVKGKFGDVALLTVEGLDKPVRTGSQVILNNLEHLRILIKDHKKVLVRVEKRGRYYTFVPPKS